MQPQVTNKIMYQKKLTAISSNSCRECHTHSTEHTRFIPKKPTHFTHSARLARFVSKKYFSQKKLLYKPFFCKSRCKKDRICPFVLIFLSTFFTKKAPPFHGAYIIFFLLLLTYSLNISVLSSSTTAGKLCFFSIYHLRAI